MKVVLKSRADGAGMAIFAGMKDYYENMMTKYIENSQMEIIFRKAYFNEIMFVIKK